LWQHAYKHSIQTGQMRKCFSELVVLWWPHCRYCICALAGTGVTKMLIVVYLQSCGTAQTTDLFSSVESTVVCRQYYRVVRWVTSSY